MTLESTSSLYSEDLEDLTGIAKQKKENFQCTKNRMIYKHILDLSLMYTLYIQIKSRICVTHLKHYI